MGQGEQLPPPGLFVDAALQQEFASSIDQLISDLGYPVKLFFEPIASGCPNCGRGPDGNSDGIYDASNPFGLGQLNIVFPSGAQCPVCVGENEIIADDTQQYQGLIGYNPKDLQFRATGQENLTIVRTKTQLVSIEDMRRAKKVFIEGVFYRLFKSPIRTGLQIRSHVNTVWIEID